ncbi:MAG: type II toxin-antitoxin system HicA family toxin [Lachnospiraceae bacterium]|nr:type II toxin-antitoxin system HicA family toxin [Lachnospiraceae bacterium]
MDMSGKEVLKLLKKSGFVEIRVEGSHHIMKSGSVEISIPVHGNKSMKKGLLNQILKDAGLK